MSEKRIKLSGAEFKKSADERNKKEQLIISQIPKIQSFFKKVDSKCSRNTVSQTREI